MPNNFHRPVRSEDGALESIQSQSAPPPATKIALPNYSSARDLARSKPARMRESGLTGGGPVAPLQGLAVDESADVLPTAPVDASVGTFGETQLLEVVIGNDDRTPVPDDNMKRNPWRQICALRITARNNQKFVGTGWFIGPRTVVTAAHCVFLHRHGGWASSIEVIPALNGSIAPFGRAVANRFRTVAGWVEERRKDSDYAVIQLSSTDLGQQLGWFSVVSLDNSGLSDTIANVSGYPADRDNAQRQYFHARKLVSVSSEFLFYDIDTFGGQSGSPVFQQLTDGSVRAVGVHTTGSAVENSATRITDPIIENFAAWKEE